VASKFGDGATNDTKEGRKKKAPGGKIRSTKRNINGKRPKKLSAGQKLGPETTINVKRQKKGNGNKRGRKGSSREKQPYLEELARESG